MPKESGDHDDTPFKAKSVTLKELRKLALQGQLRRRRRGSKYRDELLAFKDSQDPARKIEGLTESQLSQLISAIPKVFRSGEITTKTLDIEGQGPNKRLDILLVKRTPETDEILSTAIVYSASKGRVTEVKSETSQES